MHSRRSARRRQRQVRHRGFAGRQSQHADPVRRGENTLDAPTLLLRRSALINAGRLHGNQFVLRLLDGASGIQRQTEAPPTTKGALLVGLKRGDGLQAGTFNTRERVIILQQKLNEKMHAGLSADGKFGAKTEEILREFQESMELSGSETVDQATADLLMTESTLPQKQDDVPAEDKKEIKAAGLELTEAAEPLKKVAARHVAAGMKMGKGSGKIGLIAGAFFEAGSEIAEGAFRLADAGALMSVGDLASVNAAGPKMQLAGQAFLIAGQHLQRARDLLTETNNRSYKVAAMALEQYVAAIVNTGQNLSNGGRQLKAYQPGDIPGKQIGDPLVGLKRGDGIVFGTWERRPRVKELQTIINDQGFDKIKVDGKFGNNTASALHTVQLVRGITPSDSVDRATAQALRKGPNPIGPKPEDGLTLAGNHLKVAGADLVSAENSLLGGALAIRSGPGPGDKEASEALQPGSKELAKAGEGLGKAGLSLSPLNSPAKE